MSKRRLPAEPEARRPKDLTDGQRSTNAHGQQLVSHQVGALPVINHFLERMRLHEFLKQHLPPDDKRSAVDTARVVLLLVRNVLVSREPIYGVVEWACNYAPDLFDLWGDQLQHLNDDRVGRSLDRLHETVGMMRSSLIMDVVSHVVHEFGLSLDELHNDSTSVTLTGQYADAKREQQIGDLQLPAITWGHNKDHRPDLKQLLYILTVSDDGGVPVYFHATSGNVTDDKTHQTTWKLMAELVQRPDFVYVADCKLASAANMNEIARLSGRFITVLPANRKENSQFRQRMRQEKTRAAISWKEVLRITDEESGSGNNAPDQSDETIRDIFQVCTEGHTSKEGYRLLWFHSLGKAKTDSQTRARQLERTECELEELCQRIEGPRTRFRSRNKIEADAREILQARGMQDLLRIEITQTEEEKFRQTTRGRPTSKTKYKRTVVTRFHLKWEIDAEQMELARANDGVFPLITNIRDWDAQEILQAYKRQPIIEKRFSQLKTDFRVAPVYLKNVRRIVGLLTVYFFALMVQSLIERELRQAMEKTGCRSLPLYPEGRACRRPTTRQLIDVFAPLQRHTPTNQTGDNFTSFVTQLSPIHARTLKLLRIPTTTYTEQ